VLARVETEEGETQPAPVEKLLRSELDRRKREMEAKLDEGRAKAKAGDAEAAAALLHEVLGARCLFSSLGRKAAKELKKLGRAVDESELSALERELPDLAPEVGRAVEAALRAGLDAESRLALEEARAHYEAAVRLDPADPVALRYLGEYHRHHSGEWAEAERLFARLLALAADPVSRAVALHGLGKMTIHGGAFAQGLALIEASTAAWPLPLAYRNLAVYWFSEREFERAKGYVDRAVALAPDDPYNRIFAAVYLVGLGRPEEARRIARANQPLLEASYNLAAIWSQLGEREPALELLARHFYAYERYDAVRVREMREARDDFAFAPLHADPAFVELTRGAERDPDSFRRAGAATMGSGPE
jgi:tetratricopeptide (TPR) repeat protein